MLKRVKKKSKLLRCFFPGSLKKSCFPTTSVLFQKEKQEKKKQERQGAASKMSFVCFHPICNCHCLLRNLSELEQSPLRTASHCRAESVLRGRKRPETGGTTGKQLYFEEQKCKGSGKATLVFVTAAGPALCSSDFGSNFPAIPRSALRPCLGAPALGRGSKLALF